MYSHSDGPAVQLLRQPAPEDVSRQVPTPLPAEGALCHDPRIRHGLYRRGDILSASFAADGVVARCGLGQVPHAESIGEIKAKSQIGCGNEREEKTGSL